MLLPHYQMLRSSKRSSAWAPLRRPSQAIANWTIIAMALSAMLDRMAGPPGFVTTTFWMLPETDIVR